MNTLTDRILFAVSAIVTALFAAFAAALSYAPSVSALIETGALSASALDSGLFTIAPFAFAIMAYVWTRNVVLPAYRYAFRFGVRPSERFRVRVLPPVEYGRGGGAAQFFFADIETARHMARTVLNCSPGASVTIADRYIRETTRTETTRHKSGAPVSLRAIAAAAAIAVTAFGSPAFAASGEPSGAAVTGGFAFAIAAACIAAGSVIMAAHYSRRRAVRRALSVCGAAITGVCVSILFAFGALASAPETAKSIVQADGAPNGETPLYAIVLIAAGFAAAAVSFAAGYAPVRRAGNRFAAVWTEKIWRTRRRIRFAVQDMRLQWRFRAYRRLQARNARRAAPSAIARIRIVQAHNSPRRAAPVRRHTARLYAAIRAAAVRVRRFLYVQAETAIWRIRSPHSRIRFVRAIIRRLDSIRRRRAVRRNWRIHRRNCRIERRIHTGNIRRAERTARRAVWRESVRRNGGVIAACIAALPDGVKIRIYRTKWFLTKPSYRTYLKNIRTAKRIDRHNTRNAARRNVSACIAAAAFGASAVPAFAAAPDIAAAAAFVFAPFAAVSGALFIAFAASAAVSGVQAAYRRVRRTVFHTFAAERRTPPPPPSGVWPALRRAGYIAAYGIPFVIYVRVRRAVLAYVSAYIAARFPSGQLMPLMEPALSAHTVRAYIAVFVQALYRRVQVRYIRRIRRETRQFIFYAVRRAAVRENTGALQRAINTRRAIAPYSSVRRRIRRAVLIAAYGIPSAVYIRVRRHTAAYVSNYIRERFLFADIRRLLDAPTKARTVRAYAAAYVSARLQLRRELRAVRRRYGKKRRTVTMRILSAAIACIAFAAAAIAAASGEPSGVPAFAAIIAAAPFGVRQLRRGASVIIGSDGYATAADMRRRAEPFAAAAAAYTPHCRIEYGIGAYTMESGEYITEPIALFYTPDAAHTETMADIAAAYCRRYAQESFAVIRSGAPELRYLDALPRRIRRIEKWTDIIYAPPVRAIELKREYPAAHTILPDGGAFAFAVPVPVQA